MVSAPRASSTRPFAPVRMTSPGLTDIVLVSATGCAPDVEIVTSPDALLTRQAASCALAIDPENTKTTAKAARRIFKQTALNRLDMASLTAVRSASLARDPLCRIRAEIVENFRQLEPRMAGAGGKESLVMTARAGGATSAADAAPISRAAAAPAT